jgi:methylated-DNA-[protein]-cysteine S-methyltransferase
MTLAATPSALVGAWFTDAAHWPDLSGCADAADQPLLQLACAQLDDYFFGQRRRFDLPLDLGSGTAFQQAVWQALRGIAFGSACTYRLVSDRIGRPTSVRAVGAAIGCNPISIIVPCHRVIGADGSLTGYAGGLARKQALLQREGAV